MAGQPRRSRGWLALGIVALIVATFLNPLSAFADTDLVIGGQARISYANGDDVRLRDEPSYSGTLIRFLPEGTVLDVVDGPITDSDGNIWYQLSFEGDTGYIVSDYLALDNGAAPRTTNAAPGAVVGSALIAGTNNDGVRCRTAPAAGGAVIAVVPEGAIVDLIGAAQGGWQPINCAGTAGYVSTDYVSYDFSGGADFGAAEATGQATVAGTNGDGVNCRTSATTTAAVITTVAEGSVDLPPRRCPGRLAAGRLRRLEWLRQHRLRLVRRRLRRRRGSGSRLSAPARWSFPAPTAMAFAAGPAPASMAASSP